MCLRNQHVQRIREEALMGDVALNASVKLHEEAAEHAQRARHEQLELDLAMGQNPVPLVNIKIDGKLVNGCSSTQIWYYRF